MTEHGGGVDPEAFARLAQRIRYVDGDYADPATFARIRAELAGREAPHALPGHPAQPVPGGGQEPGRERLRGRRPGRGREALRARPRLRAGAERSHHPLLSREQHLPHRPLPRQGGGPEHPLLPLRQRVPGAHLEPALRRERADHHGGELRGEGPREVLRRDGRHPRRDPEPPAADRELPGHGGALQHLRRGHPRRAGQGAANGAAAEHRQHGPRAVPRLPRRARGRQGLVHGHLRGHAPVRRFLALGWRALLRAGGQEPRR